MSIVPLRVCALADNEKTRNIAASCDLMDVPFIEQVALELGGRPAEAAIGSFGRLGVKTRHIQGLLRETGASFTERVLELRLQRARRMLVDPRNYGMKIGEIARSTS